MPVSYDISDLDYKKFVENLPLAYVQNKIFFNKKNKTNHSEIINYNNLFCDLCNQDENVIKGKSLSELLPELKSEIDEWEKLYSASKKIGINKKIEKNLNQKKYSIVIYSAAKDSFYLLFNEILKANVKQNNSEKVLEQFFELSADALRLVNLDKKVIKVNKLYAAYNNKTPEDLLQKECKDKFCIKRCIEGECCITDFKKGKLKIENNFDILINEEIKHFISTAIPYYDSEENIVGVLESFKEISSIKKAQDKIQEQNIFLQTLIDNIPSPVFYKDINGIYLGCNKSFSEAIGLKSKKDIIGKTVFDIAPKEYAEIYKGADEEVFKNKTRQIYESKIIYANKSEHNVIFIKDCFKDNKGNVAGIIGIMHDISERIKIENELKESEKRYRLLAENAGDVVWTMDLNLKTLYVSPSIKNLTGYTVEEHLEQTIHQRFTPTTVEFAVKQFKTDYEKLMTGIIKDKNYTYTGEFEYYHKKGHTVWAEVKVSSIWENGVIVGIQGSSRDITERKKTQKELEQYKDHLEEKVNQRNSELIASENRFRSIVQHLKDVIWIMDINGKVKYASTSTKIVLGFDPEYFYQFNTAFDLVHPDDIESVKKDFKEVIENTNDKVPSYFRIQNKHKEWIDIEAIGDNMLSVSGIEGIIITARDITERKKAEEALRKSEEKYKLLSQLSTDAASSLVVNEDGTFTREWSTDALVHSYGYKMSEIDSYDKWIKIVHPEDWKLFLSSKNKLLKGQKVSEDFRIITKSGEIRWINNTIHPQFDEKINKFRFISAVKDITDRKRTEEALIDNEVTFKNIFNATSEGITITDMEGNYLEANQIAIERTGISRDVFFKLNIRDILKDDHEKIELGFKEIQEKGVMVMESEYMSKSGSRVCIEISSKMMNYKGERAVLHVTRDITERKEIDRKIVKTIFETEERERNRFAKDLHDGLGALLSGVKMYLNLLQKAKLADDQKSDILQKAKDLISQAASSTREIAYNIKPHELSHFGIVSTIDSFIERMNDLSNININFTHDNFKLKLDGDLELMIFRIISELINNTLKHSSATKIDITLFSEGNKFNILYSDNGKGFDVEEVLNRKNPGMGLYNIFNRLKSINAKYELNSSLQNGMDIIIEIIMNR